MRGWTKITESFNQDHFRMVLIGIVAVTAVVTALVTALLVNILPDNLASRGYEHLDRFLSYEEAREEVVSLVQARSLGHMDCSYLAASDSTSSTSSSQAAPEDVDLGPGPGGDMGVLRESVGHPKEREKGHKEEKVGTG